MHNFSLFFPNLTQNGSKVLPAFIIKVKIDDFWKKKKKSNSLFCFTLYKVNQSCFLELFPMYFDTENSQTLALYCFILKSSKKLFTKNRIFTKVLKMVFCVQEKINVFFENVTSLIFRDQAKKTFFSHFYLLISKIPFFSSFSQFSLLWNGKYFRAILDEFWKKNKENKELLYALL